MMIILDRRIKMNKKLQEKALRVIECIVTSDEPITQYQVDAIYRFAHIGTGNCVHHDWEKELDCVFETFKDAKML